MKKVMMLGAVACALPLFAKIELATPFSDGMVLQRDREVPVWGKAAPGSEVTVRFAGNTVSVIACKGGCWKVLLPAMSASKEDRTMTVTECEPGWFGSATDELEIKDVLVGEVWMCAGQSNTDCPVWGKGPRYRDGWGAMSLTSVRKPFVRLVKTPLVASEKPRYGYKAVWMKMTEEMMDRYERGERMPSAMGYYYALELANALDIPIGLVDSSWGGTNIDAWTPRSGYAGIHQLDDVAALPVVDEKTFDGLKANGVYKDINVCKSWIQQPTALWNGMVAAYAPMACRGFIWYQGCHNAGEYQRYAVKMHALYNGWAKEFKNPDLKLYFVQLTPWGNAGIANIQMAQAKFEREEKNAGMAVINDVGNLDDIHPNDKRTVAKRLSLFALKRDYGWSHVQENAPTVKDWKVEGDKVRLTFNNTKEIYIYNADRSLDLAMEICGADGVWKPAKVMNAKELTGKKAVGKRKFDGTLVGEGLLIAAEGVAEPKKVRYLHVAPWRGNIYSDRCLPLASFILGE